MWVTSPYIWNYYKYYYYSINLKPATQRLNFTKLLENNEVKVGSYLSCLWFTRLWPPFLSLIRVIYGIFCCISATVCLNSVWGPVVPEWCVCIHDKLVVDVSCDKDLQLLAAHLSLLSVRSLSPSLAGSRVSFQMHCTCHLSFSI